MSHNLHSFVSKVQRDDQHAGHHGVVPHGFAPEILSQVPLFCGVSASDLEVARGVVVRRDLAQGDTLLTEDESGQTLFFLMEGAFKITVRKGEGTVLLGLCGQGELLGELSAIDGNARSATVVAQTPCVVGAVSAHDFWHELWPLQPVAMNMAHALAGRVRRLTAKVQAMATLDVRGRLAFQLVSLARDHARVGKGGALCLPFGLTQAELAQMVGTSRVQVNQLMMTWTKHGFICAKRNSITVFRLDALCQMFPASLDSPAPTE